MREIKNLSRSIRDRLYNYAKQEGKDFLLILILYMQERLLYRISQSRYFGRFVLKGGLLLHGIDVKIGRPTRDMDFLGRVIAGDLDEMVKIFKEVSAIEVADGIVFDPGSVTAEKITKDADYEGVRVNVIGYVEKARIALQIDVGFGDIVDPEITEMEYPTLLEGIHPPIIKAYSLESVIAEKFEAAVKLSILNSRMKDFYDIFTLLNHKDFQGVALKEAIKATFENRETPLDRKTVIFKEKFYKDEERQRNWAAFVRRIGRKDTMDFGLVMESIKAFLLPVYEAICSDEDFVLKWDHEAKQWTRFCFAQQ